MLPNGNKPVGVAQSPGTRCAMGSRPPWPVWARKGCAGWPANDTGVQQPPADFAQAVKTAHLLARDRATTVTSCAPLPVSATWFGSMPYVAAEYCAQRDVAAGAGEAVGGSEEPVALTGAATAVIRGVVAAGGVAAGDGAADPHPVHSQVNSRQLAPIRDFAPILRACRASSMKGLKVPDCFENPSTSEIKAKLRRPLVPRWALCEMLEFGYGGLEVVCPSLLNYLCE